MVRIFNETNWMDVMETPLEKHHRWKGPGAKQRVVNATTRPLSSGNICSFISSSFPLEGNCTFNGIGLSVRQKKGNSCFL